jgi:hypothetical protein
MDDLLKKLCYKGQERISVIEAPGVIKKKLESRLTGVQIDSFIDPRFLYDFILIFIKTPEDIDKFSPKAIHNLSPDGKLWMAFHKGTSKKYSSEINRDKGWGHFEEAGFKRVSQVVIDKDWSALRFRNSKFIKSSSKED